MFQTAEPHQKFLESLRYFKQYKIESQRIRPPEPALKSAGSSGGLLFLQSELI